MKITLWKYKRVVRHHIRAGQLMAVWGMIICSLLAGITMNKQLMLLVLVGCFVVILIRAKFSFFSAFSFILLFSYLQEHIAAIDSSRAGGMLFAGMGIPIYIHELYICTVFFYIVEYIFFSLTDVLLNEKKMYTNSLELNRKVAHIFAFGALFLIILSYPSMPTLSGTLSRNEGMIQSSRFVQIAMFLLALTYDSLKKYKDILVAWIISLIWVLFHGDRVIVFGFLIYCALKYLNSQPAVKSHVDHIKNVIIKYKKILLVVAAAVCVAILGIRLQLSRSGYSTQNLNLSTIVNSILIQGTACDVVYVFNCATDLWKHGNQLNGYTLLQYIVCWIPFLPNPYYPASVIMNYYTTLGGGLFFAEPMMNFGLVGTLLFSSAFLFFLCAVLNNPSRFKCFFWIPFVITIFRMTWYLGLDSWVTMSIYIAPILYYIAKKVK